MKKFFYLLVITTVAALVLYTCTSPQREAYDKIDKALDESERYTDEVEWQAQRIVDICIDYEEEDSVPLDSILHIAMDIVDEPNGALDILDEARSDLLREVYTNEY